MSCKKGGFVSIRHNVLYDLMARIVSEVCKDTEIERKFLCLTPEELHERTTNQSNEARLDIRTQGFCERGQQAFFNTRVLEPNACRYLNKSQQKCDAMNELKKKRLYNKRVLQVDYRMFTPLLFSI